MAWELDNLRGGADVSTSIYEIQVEGQLRNHWSDWFAGLDIKQGRDNETILAGELKDQADLYGVRSIREGMKFRVIAGGAAAGNNPKSFPESGLKA